ncbi:polysaccharide biosynthesis protein [Ruegeria pomeroyi]|uniref:polysaccharide biosynthesis protein n=1 Tax=Ruegeria pomeroyi TaxID=89184 RepID=UPI001F48D648|nr:nucleoside-diphosphate sugar epimerase/dehydratase [Ruegeria pomeroyi]MCE8510019.1 polysaccharide biosynthesis protein [Ruegeria pomeroyi]
MFLLLTSLSRRWKALIFLGIDLCWIPVALYLAYLTQSPPQTALYTLLATLPVLPYLLVITMGLSIWLGLPYLRLNDYQYYAMGLTMVLAVAAAMTFWGLARINGLTIPEGSHVVFALIYGFAMGISRIVLHYVVETLYRRATPRTRVLIYGAGATGIQLASALKNHERIDPVAFVDDNTALHGMLLSGLAVFPPARLKELIASRRIERVLLTMPSQSQPKQARILRTLQKLDVEVQALPSFAQLIGQEALVDKLAPVPSQEFLGRAAHNVALNEVGEKYTGRSILISGAGGTIGSELCRQVLACRPGRLVLYELSELALYTVHQELSHIAEECGVDLVPVLGSVVDARQVRRVLREHRVQVVLHAAAYKHVPLVETNPLPGLTNNVLGTQALASEAAAAGIERFILVSSDKAVRPTNVMGASKRLAELVIQDLATRANGTVFSIVRFGNVLGSSGSVVPLFQDQISRGGPVTVTDTRVKRYFMTIREAVQLVLTAGAEARGGEVFVLDMGPPIPIMQLARQVIQSAGYRVRDDATPDGDIEIAVIGLRPGEKLEEELTLSGELIHTRHQKILCARETFLSEIEVAKLLRHLREVLAASDEDAARILIRDWVEGYTDWTTIRETS